MALLNEIFIKQRQVKLMVDIAIKMQTIIRTYLSVQSHIIPLKLQFGRHLTHFVLSALHNLQFIIELHLIPQI